MFYWVTSILLFYVSFSSIELSADNWAKKKECPKILGIPACYIVASNFVLAAICHLLNTLVSNQIYFVFIGIPGVIALIGSITELTGKTICPKTASGKPMCFYSLAFCVALIITKILSF